MVKFYFGWGTLIIPHGSVVSSLLKLLKSSKSRKCDFELNDQLLSGKLQETKNNEWQDLLDEYDLTQSTRNLAKRVSVNQLTIQRMVRSVNKIIKSDHWVPHKLAERNIADRLDTCLLLLACY